MVRVAVVIPAHNEEQALPAVLKGVKKALDGVYEYKIFLVDDGSEDETARVALENGVEVASHAYATGVGGATKTGFLMSKEWSPDYIIQIDADGQHSPSDLCKFLDEISGGEHDLIIGSRFLGASPEINFVRRIGISFFTWLVNRLTSFKLTDITNGYRVFRAELLDELFFSSEKHWAIEMTLLASKNGLKVKEVPIETMLRESGFSQFHNLTMFFWYPLRAVKQIVSAYV